MAAPVPYARLANFVQYALDHPTATYNPSEHDSELNAVALTLTGLTYNQGLIQRNDGALANQAVHPDSLSTATKALIGAGNSGQLNWTPRGLWATATDYVVGDVVQHSTMSYVCADDHTSGVFATDQAAGIWISLGVVTFDASQVSYTPTPGETTDVQTQLRKWDVVSTIAELKAKLAPTGAQAVLVMGYTDRGDGGGGFYFWDAADVRADNAGTIIQLDALGDGRFNKLF